MAAPIIQELLEWRRQQWVANGTPPTEMRLTQRQMADLADWQDTNSPTIIGPDGQKHHFELHFTDGTVGRMFGMDLKLL